MDAIEQVIADFGGTYYHFFTTPTGYLYANESKEWKRRFDRVRAY